MVLCALVALCGGAQAGPVVSLKGGQLEGVGTAGMGSFFLGVPFAAPPLGARRWMPPADAPPWAPDTLDASQFKPTCAQQGGEPGRAAPSEDCLYLDICLSHSQAPPPRPRPEGRPPVLANLTRRWVLGRRHPAIARLHGRPATGRCALRARGRLRGRRLRRRDAARHRLGQVQRHVHGRGAAGRGRLGELPDGGVRLPRQPATLRTHPRRRLRQLRNPGECARRECVDVQAKSFSFMGRISARRFSGCRRTSARSAVTTRAS